MKKVCRDALENLRNEPQAKPLMSLSLYDVDELVKKCDINNLEQQYYIGILYTLCLYNIAYKHIIYQDINSSYIHNYLGLIISTLKRFKRMGYTSIELSIFDEVSIEEIINMLIEKDVKKKELV